MKDHTPLIIIFAFLIASTITVIQADKKERAQGGTPQYIWKGDNIKQIFKP